MGETILISLFICKLKKYKIREFLISPYILPILLIEILHLVFQLIIFSGNYDFIHYGAILKTLYLSSYIFIIFKYEIYISAIMGSIFVLIGGFLNDIAINFNGGYMPIYPSLSYITGYIEPGIFPLANDIHILGDTSTKLKFLTDYIDLGYAILSIGDIFIRFFVFIVIYNSIKSLNTKEKQEALVC